MPAFRYRGDLMRALGNISPVPLIAAEAV